MQHRNAVTSQYLCSKVQCGNATQLRRSMKGPLKYLQHHARNCLQYAAVGMMLQVLTVPAASYSQQHTVRKKFNKSVLYFEP